MPRLDPLIESLLCENGTELRFETGAGVRLALPSGTITPIEKPLSTKQILSSIAELAPAGVAGTLVANRDPVTFPYLHPKGSVMVTVRPDGERVVVMLSPMPRAVEAAPATQPEKPQAEPARKAKPAEPRLKKKKRPLPEVEVELDVGDVGDLDDEEMAAEEKDPPRVITMAPPASLLPRVDVARTGVHATSMDRLLEEMIEAGASDIHFTTGFPPCFRVDGDLVAAKGWAATSLEELTGMIYSIMPARNRKEFEDAHDTDFAHENGRSRFRVNVFLERHGIGSVIRQIPTKIRTVEEMGLAKHIIDLCALPKGLVLVTGPTGSGKSTTLAGMIDHINRTRTDHIITIEDPVEFVHEHKKCVVHQREVNVHTRSFKSALRAALREDPDVVLVGEMRDLETVAIAIETAETGHLVFGTLHTNTAPSSVDRIIDQFPSDRQAQIRIMLSETLKSVITQTLCKKIGGGRIPVLEVLMVNNAVANLIREGKTFQIPSMMQTGRGIGMVTQTDALFEMVQKKKVEAHEALNKAVEKPVLRQMLERAGFRVE